MSKRDANGWAYIPGLWVRDDGARVERKKSGPRKGVWSAELPGSSLKRPQFILTDGTFGHWLGHPETAVSWQGYQYAKDAKDALDKIRIEERRKIVKALRALDDTRPTGGSKHGE